MNYYFKFYKSPSIATQLIVLAPLLMAQSDNRVTVPLMIQLAQ